MPERRLQRTRDAYKGKGYKFVVTSPTRLHMFAPNDPKWRPAHENTAERLKQAAQWITKHYLTQCDPGDENDDVR